MEEKDDLSKDTRYDPSVNLRYITGKSSVVFENGVRITVGDFNKAVRDKTLPALMKACQVQPDSSGWDYKYLISTGTLRKRGIHSRDPVGKKEEPKAKLLDVTKLERDVLSAYIIMAVIVVVGVLSMIMSAYHGWSFLMLMNKPPVVAVITGIVFVLYSSTAFSAARHFKDLGKLPAAIIFVITGVLVVAFSVICTLGVSYEQYKTGDAGKVAMVTEAGKSTASSSAFLDGKNKQIADYEKTIKKAEDDAEYWKGKNWKLYEKHVNTADAYRGKLETARNEVIAASMTKATADEVTVAASNDADVYEFIYKVIPWVQEDSLRFFMFAVPSVFYDVIAPFALFIVLLLVDILNKRRVEQAPEVKDAQSNRQE